MVSVSSCDKDMEQANGQANLEKSPHFKDCAADTLRKSLKTKEEKWRIDRSFGYFDRDGRKKARLSFLNEFAQTLHQTTSLNARSFIMWNQRTTNDGVPWFHEPG